MPAALRVAPPRRRGRVASPTGYRALAGALGRDVRAALGSGPVRAFLLIEVAAAGWIVLRRGPDFAPLVAVIWAAATAYGLLAWFAGRSLHAVPTPDAVRGARAELAAACVVATGIVAWSFGRGDVGIPLTQLGIIGWFCAGYVSGYRPADVAWIWRTWWPFAPLLLAIALPKLPVIGLGIVSATLAGLASGIVQQLLLLVVLHMRLEAVARRGDLAAVLASLVFGLVHVPMDLGQAAGDWTVAFANATVLQASIGMVFCLAFQRHRAPLALGFGHALLMA